MAQVLDNKMASHDYFARIAREVPAGAGAPAWVDRLRATARARFEKVGFPARRNEAWRFTDVSPIARTAYEPAPRVSTDVAGALLDRFTFRNDDAIEIVLVNGHFDANLSKIGRLPHGAKVMSLAQALATEPDLVEPHLARHAAVDKNPFVALNTGVVTDGAFVYLPAGTKVEQPIHIAALSVGGERPTASHPRVLIVAGDGASATIVETYAGDPTGAAAYFTNAVTEIVCGADCNIDHCRLQAESPAAHHISTMQVHLGRATNFVSHAVSTGAKLSRNDLNCLMNGEYAYATLNGLVLIGGQQHCDNHTLLHHEKANCPSHELYKHVLAGESSAVFKGQIFVQKDAQKTDSKQTSKTLLLSDDARMNSQPALEIYADDVKCTHGSTTGPADEDMVFYLRTRGVGLEAARHLLTYAFAADVTRRIKVDPFRIRVEDHMAAQFGLPQDLRITDVTSHDRKAM
ncbi:MAG TPA: Fe-S cluster assembly protein SufD [Tepidisphaeraceae bacterium]|nr:Fe-S cluster assembly protein SufD [Tepidisphaeraceae bacterium]